MDDMYNYFMLVGEVKSISFKTLVITVSGEEFEILIEDNNLKLEKGDRIGIKGFIKPKPLCLVANRIFLFEEEI